MTFFEPRPVSQSSIQENSHAGRKPADKPRIMSITSAPPLATPLAGLAIAAEAMGRAQEIVAASVSRLAAAASPSNPAGDSLDLSAEMVALMQSRLQMGVATEVARTFDELAGQSLNLLA